MGDAQRFGIVAVLAAGCSPGGDLAPGLTMNASGATAATEAATDAETSDSSTTASMGSQEGSGGTAGLSAEIDCAMPPLAAVGAEYAHQLMLADDAGLSWTWMASGLPPGMAIGPLDGSLSGTPTEEGEFEVEVGVSHPDGDGAQTCTLSVGEAMRLDLDALGGPCITPQDDVADFIVGGDGSPLRCETPGGVGEGRLPEGIEVDADSCAAQGDADDTFGTWVWVTHVEQSGLRVPVPYCYTIQDPAMGAYTVTGEHSGGATNHLEPAVRTFVPGEPIRFGGDGDPLFRVTQETPLNPIHFHFSFTIAASPFGDCGQGECFGLDPMEIVTDDAGGRIGFTHELFARGPAVPEEFEDRPWVFTVRTFYCMADNAVDCDDDNYVDNGNGELRFGVIMQPQAD